MAQSTNFADIENLDDVEDFLDQSLMRIFFPHAATDPHSLFLFNFRPSKPAAQSRANKRHCRSERMALPRCASAFWRRLLGAVQLRQVRVRMQGERAPFWSVHDEQRDAKLPLLSGLLDIPCVVRTGRPLRGCASCTGPGPVA